MSVGSFADIFSHSEGCLFVLFMVSFAVQKLLNLIRSCLFIFVFILIILGSGSKKILLQFMSKCVLPMFSSKSLVVSGLTFRSLIHFEFIFVYGVRECSNFIANWQRSNTVTVTVDDMILHIENPKDATRKLLELVSEFSKVAGYNTQKFLAFLYTNNERSEREIKEIIPFTIATKRIKYLGINLPKGGKRPYAGNCKILMKEIKDDTDGKIYHVLGLKESIL